jgi:undecaprenyl-diphosphatase
MNLLEGILLGAVQGLTEFLPVSSSGHLVLAQALFGIREPGILLEVAVHVATLLAVLIYFSRRLLALAASVASVVFCWETAIEAEKADARFVGFLLLASIPAGIAGLLFRDALEKAFEDPRLVCAFLAATGLILLATRLAPAPGASMNAARALLVGTAQGLALLPGISRSGSTISAGLFLRLDGERAAEFSLLLSIPAVAGAALLEARKIESLAVPLPLAAAFLAAFATGMLAIVLLFGVLRKRTFWLFGIYCLAAGAAGAIALSLR